MGAQAQGAAVEHQRIARNTGAVVISTAEAAVDHQNFAAALHGAFALYHLYGHMAVHNVMPFAIQAEFRQNFIRHGNIIIDLVVGVGFFGVRALVADIQMLKGGHGASAENGRKLAAPQIPQKVLSLLALGAALGGKIAVTGALFAEIKQRLAAVALAVKHFFGKFTVHGHGHTAMEHQVAVFHMVHMAHLVHKPHMALQLFAFTEGFHQLFHHIGFALGQAGRVLGVHGGKLCVTQKMRDAVHLNRAVLIVDAANKIAILHLEIRVAVDHLTFQLKHDHRNGNVHQCAAAQAGVAELKAGVVALGHPDGKVAIAVHFIGKLAQTAQVQAVALLQRFHIGIRKRSFQHGGNANGAACRCAHPNRVVVAPLNIHIVVIHQGIHNAVRARAAVIQIAHNVQFIHRKALDQLAEVDNKIVGLPVFDHADDDLIVIHFLVVVLKMRMKQFIQNMCAFVGQAAAHTGAGVLAAYQPAKLDQAQQRVLVPVIQIFLALRRLQQRQLLLGIIDQGGKLLTFLGRGVFLRQHRIHLFTDHARSAVQHMAKRFVFTVQIAHKMLGALGQAQHGLLIDHLAGGHGNGGILLREQLQIAQVFLYQLLFFLGKLHSVPPVFRAFPHAFLPRRRTAAVRRCLKQCGNAFSFSRVFCHDLYKISSEKSIIFPLTIIRKFCLVNRNFRLFLSLGVCYTYQVYWFLSKE